VVGVTEARTFFPRWVGEAFRTTWIIQMVAVLAVLGVLAGIMFMTSDRSPSYDEPYRKQFPGASMAEAEDTCHTDLDLKSAVVTEDGVAWKWSDPDDLMYEERWVEFKSGDGTDYYDCREDAWGPSP